MALLAGPRLGLGTDPSNSFKVWAQYDSAATIKVQYRITGATTFIDGPTGTADATKSNTIVLEVTGLERNTRYDYRLVENGTPDTAYWTRTFPDASGGRFVFYHAGDPHSTSGTDNYDGIKTDYDAFDALGVAGLVFNMGDFYLGGATAVDRFADYKLVLARTEVFKYLPALFMWDDFDYAGNNSAAAFPLGTTIPIEVWDLIWRDMPKPSTNGFNYAIEVCSVPLIVLDNRSQRASQTDLQPDLTGIEIVSDNATCLGSEQRAWAKARIAEYSDRGLVFMATGTNFLDNINTVSSIGSGRRDSFGIFYKAERNELMEEAVRFGYGVSGSMFILTGDDHRDCFWANIDFPRVLREAVFTDSGTPAHSAGLGMRARVMSCSSGMLSGVPKALAAFGTAPDYNQAVADTPNVIRWDITSGSKGRNVTARISYVNILTGAVGDVDPQGNVGDWFFQNGRIETFDAATSGVQNYPPENAPRTGIRFQRSFTDDVSGGLFYEDDVQRDFQGRLREHADVDSPDADELREGFELPGEIDEGLDPLE